MAHNYILQVTAGPSYDMKEHKIVPVNYADPVSISTEHMDIDLNVRIQHYRGLPPNSPATSPYFSLPQHAYNNDQYSIAFRFAPHKSINGDDIVFGNDFDHPIRDRLPPGFGTAFKIVKWAIDPGLDGDVYADQPYLYGPLTSSLNTLRVGQSGVEKGKKLNLGEDGEGMVFEEGGEGDGEELRREKGVPDTDAARKKWFLTENNRKEWEFEADREYWYFALRLPGFNLPIMKYWDGQGLRYVLKNRKTNTVYLVVLFTLYLKEDVNEDGTIKEGVIGGKPFTGTAPGVEDHDHGKYEFEHEHTNGNVHAANGHAEAGTAAQKAVIETSEDDVD